MEQTFQEVIAAAVAKFGETVLADRLMLSRPTIVRWAAGTNMPHPAVRESLKQTVLRML